MPGDTLYAVVGCSKEIESQIQDQGDDGLFTPVDLTGKAVSWTATHIRTGATISKAADLANGAQGYARVVLSPSDLGTYSARASVWRWRWLVYPGPDGSTPRAYPEQDANLLEVQTV